MINDGGTLHKNKIEIKPMLCIISYYTKDIAMPDLTTAQKNFIECTDKYIRLLAPAGCGKTFSIIEKTRAILRTNPRARINIFTFTRGAANEIRERCGDTDVLTVNTLNSWGNNYIKTNALRNARIVATAADKRICVLNNLQSVWQQPEYAAYEKVFSGRGKGTRAERMMELADLFKNIGFVHTKFTQYATHNATVYFNHLEFIQSVGLTRYYDTIVDEIIHTFFGGKTPEDKHQFIIENWIPFWADCIKQMMSSGLYTLDDQKYIANITLAGKVGRGERWNGSAKMDYIMIDEFQDISPLDAQLIFNLQCLNDASLIIVGDDDQAIYEFRGAAPYFILNPEDIFGRRFTTIILDKNFRSPGNIVKKSMKLIKHNIKRADKVVTPHSSMAPASIELRCHNTQTEMIDGVIRDIQQSLDTPGERVVVLSRLKASLLPYQVLLTKENIPYAVNEDLAFFLTGAADKLIRAMQIKTGRGRLRREDLLALICTASRNEIYENARGTLGRFLLVNNAKQENIQDVMRMAADTYPKLFKSVFTESFISQFCDATDRFMQADTVFDALECLLTHFDGLKQNYSRSLEDLYYRDPPLASLLDFAAKYGDDYDAFIDDFTLAIEKAKIGTDDDARKQTGETPRIFLSTALRVKGQQYDKVIILDVNDGTWPKSQAKNDPDAYEAERRLFYVAATRSRKSLHLYRSHSHNGEMTTMSPFIGEGAYDTDA